MNTSVPAAASAYARLAPRDQLAQAPASAVSWPAIAAGAAAATALSLILLALGSGLGFAAVSPWSQQGVDATTLSYASVLWLILTSAAASGLGGYIAARLRVRGTDVDSSERLFHDGAHGFLSWALATLISAVLLSTVAGSLFKAAASASAATGAAIGSEHVDWTASAGFNNQDYFVDKLLRSNNPRATDPDYSLHMEVGQILAVALREGELDAADRLYLSQRVSAVSGDNAAEADLRVTQTFGEARTALAEFESAALKTADSARELGARLSLWIFVALLIGAFVGSYTATLGGRQRDSRI